MGIINILDPQTSNLIAAGEVVDRPSSVVKELMENAIDAGADSITVEIKNGGSSLIRITDNGIGISEEDLPKTILRHATSKIKNPEDLTEIMTLGFRGEALAAISSVSRFQIITKQRDCEFGRVLESEGESITKNDVAGCPDGTTITVRDLFFNVPARRKFLKKDATEAASVASVVEKIALSHPEISIKLISDGRLKVGTSGNGKLFDTIYSVFGKDFANTLIKADLEYDGIHVHGYVSKPENSRSTRSMQHFFVNNRCVRSKSMIFALEDSYKTYIMTEKYPACILCLDIDFGKVDVNVHPSKLEVRFSDERVIYQATYYAVKQALENIKNAFSDIPSAPKTDYARAYVPIGESKPETIKIEFSKKPKQAPSTLEKTNPFMKADNTVPKKEIFDTGNDSYIPRPIAKPIHSVASNLYSEFHSEKAPISEPIEISKKAEEEKIEHTKSEDYRILGSLFDAYIIVEKENDAIFIDKHAAHERILYEKLRKTKKTEGVQALLTPIILTLSKPQINAIYTYSEEIKQSGFSVDPFGENTVAIRGIPAELAYLPSDSLSSLIEQMADDLLKGKSASDAKTDIFDKVLFSMACKAAMKAGRVDREADIKYVVDELNRIENINYCPHGRPVMIKIPKSKFEKMFFRT